MRTLPEDSSICTQVLPAMWAGYRCQLSNICPPEGIVDFTSKVIQKGLCVPQEIADKISKDYYLGSVHDFCVSHFGRNLTDKDHERILLTANEFVKNGTIIEVDENEKDLIKLLATKVVVNAHQRANHAMASACFLHERGRLPKENVFMLQKGVSPIFYDKNEFDRSEMLQKEVFDVPDDRLFRSFDNWINCFGMRYNFNQMKHLLGGMRYMNALIMKKAAQTHLIEQRHPHRRTEYVSRVWRNRFSGRG